MLRSPRAPWPARTLLFTALLAMTAAGAARASGSYCPLPPRAAVVIDATRYDLGKHVFAADLPLPSPAGDVEAQRATLEALSAKLPVGVRERARLGALAGRLDRRQLEALAYFLQVRYRIS